MTELDQPFIVGIGGTMQRNASSERVLGMALASARSQGARTHLFAGPEIAFPHFDLKDSAGVGAAQEFCSVLRKADGIILSSPCYHGSISGLIKNALDYIELMRGDSRPYFDGRAVGCIGCGAGNQGPSMVVTELRTIVHSLRGWCTPLAVAINTTQVTIGDSSCSDPHITSHIETLSKQVVEFAKMSMRH
jgi:FMN reductase